MLSFPEWEWRYPIQVGTAWLQAVENPELYAWDYSIMTGKRRIPVTFGFEVEQDQDVLYSYCKQYPNTCFRDGSGPFETSFGVYKTPLEALHDFFLKTNDYLRNWFHMTVFNRGCGSHVHVRPYYFDWRDKYENEWQMWTVVWNTLIDLNYVLQPLAVWGVPRRYYFEWANYWPDEDGGGYPARYGRRSVHTMRRVWEDERNESGPVLGKHVDGYRITSLAGISGDTANKPVTFEYRAFEAYPLFMGLYLLIVQRVLHWRLMTGLSSKFKRDFYERIFNLAICIEDNAIDRNNLQWSYYWEGAYDANKILEQRQAFINCFKDFAPVEFERDRSFWPETKREPREKYHFKNLWELFTTLLRTIVATPGTPYYRARVMVMYPDCDARIEALESYYRYGDGLYTFKKAITSKSGEFSWLTCHHNTEPTKR